MDPHTSVSYFFFFKWPGAHRDLPSFPTRRSSDLTNRASSHAGEGPPASAAIDAATSRTSASDRKSTCLNSSHPSISYAVFCLKKKKKKKHTNTSTESK